MHEINIENIRIITNLDYKEYLQDVKEIVNDIITDLLDNHTIVDLDQNTMIFLEKHNDKLVVTLLDYCRNYNEVREINNFFNVKEQTPTSDRLTKEEQIFAEQHHDEIYKFLNSKKLSIEEYYDIAVLGYLKGVKDYCRKESARQFTFSAVATRAMLDCIYKNWRSESAQKRKLNHVPCSLDANIIEEGKESNLYDIVADTRNVIEDFETSEMLKYLFKTLSHKGTEVLKMLIKGYSKVEIQRSCNLKRKAFESEMQIIKNNYLRLCNC